MTPQKQEWKDTNYSTHILAELQSLVWFHKSAKIVFDIIQTWIIDVYSNSQTIVAMWRDLKQTYIKFVT